MRRVLVLRPEPGASATVERARDLGLDAVAIPLFRIEPVPWTAPDASRFDALLLSSANAVRQGGPHLQELRDLPAYAVGEATAEAARAAGFAIATVGDAGIDRLLDTIPAGLRLLHPCGEHRKDASTARQKVVPVTVYRATEIPDPELVASSNAVALIHSPRAGRRLAALMRDRRRVAIAALSPAAAEAVGTGWEVVAAASEPTDDALLALAARLCNKPSTR